MSNMNKTAIKNAALIAAIALIVFECITVLVQMIDPQGGLLRVDYHNPVQHIIIIAVSFGFGIASYFRACRKNKSNE